MTKENKKNMRGTKYVVLATALYLLLASGASALKTEDNKPDNSQNQAQIYQDSLNLASVVDLNYDSDNLEGSVNSLDVESRKKKVIEVMPESKPYIDMVFEKSLRKGIVPEEFCAIIENESDWNADATSYRGCKGLSQMNPRYHKLKNYYDPDENLEAGISYYDFLRKKFETREAAVAAYHTGQNRVMRWLKSGKWDGKSIDNIPSRITRRYVRHVLSTSDKINYDGYIENL